MLVLAIDTALAACSACLLDADAGLVRATESLPMQRGHAEALMPLIARVMRQARTAFSEIDRVAVTVGPGSFTGLRVGLSAARGIALAAGKPAVGLTTLSAFAAPRIGDSDAPVLTAIDARHGQVFWQLVSGDGSELIAPRIGPLADVAGAAGAFGTPRLVGNAAALLGAIWPAIFDSAIDPQPAPAIEWVAWLGAAADPSAALPHPYYLRAPDAQPQMAPVVAGAAA